jgi:peptidoglycan/xylan/chitin deacetylase (PgdA/CDA1 family)
VRPPTAAGADSDASRLRRQAIVGLVMLPLTILPFFGYFALTQEGALVWERLRLAISPPTLPTLSPADAAWVRQHTPSYTGTVALLLYHGIGSGADGDGGYSVSPERFAEQLATLRAAGMHTVTARDVADALAGRRALPPNAVMISFDDGRSDAMMYADPLLRQGGMRATMFVITGAAADPGVYYVSWDGLRRYEADGRWDLESHSARSHFEWNVGGRLLPALTSIESGETIEAYRRRVTTDLAAASTAISSHGGHRPVAFAYPFGAYGTGYDRRTNDPRLGPILHQAVASDYEIAFDQDDQTSWGLTGCDADPYHLHRLEVGDWSGRTLLSRISDAAAAFHGEPCRGPGQHLPSG